MNLFHFKLFFSVNQRNSELQKRNLPCYCLVVNFDIWYSTTWSCNCLATYTLVRWDSVWGISQNNILHFFVYWNKYRFALNLYLLYFCESWGLMKRHMPVVSCCSEIIKKIWPHLILFENKFSFSKDIMAAIQISKNFYTH